MFDDNYYNVDVSHELSDQSTHHYYKIGKGNVNATHN